MGISDRIRKLLVGDPFGDVYPERLQPVVSVLDGRTVAMRILADYMSELTFYRSGGVGKMPVPFQIARKNIHVEAFPDYEEDLVFPSIAFLPGRGEYVPIGLTAFIEEASRDVYAPGTALQWMSEYTETFTIELWASQKPERRALVAGLEQALVPTAQLFGIRFQMPDYYQQLVCFTLNGRTNIDDNDSAKNRRRAHMEVEIRYNVVALVNVSELNPLPVIDTKDHGFTFDPAADTAFKVGLEPDPDDS